jgi:RNA recognition motif-containing protein
MNALEVVPDGRSLFLGDLSVYCTEKNVRDFFLPFGPIETIKLKRSSNDRNHLSYGFVKYIHTESAEIALDRLQGAVFLGRPLR